jgi:hypothetical protein
VVGVPIGGPFRAGWQERDGFRDAFDWVRGDEDVVESASPTGEVTTFLKVDVVGESGSVVVYSLPIDDLGSSAQCQAGVVP